MNSHIVGDTILIPPKWWHQVYHLQPSIALAAQYMNDVVASRVIDHIIAWTGPRPADLPENFKMMSNYEKVTCAIKLGLISRHGIEKGSTFFDELYSS